MKCLQGRSEEGPSQKDKRKIRLFRTDKKEIKQKIKDTILFTLKKNPKHSC